MRVLFFGTYDEAAHPRVRVLREGLVASGAQVSECNVPLGVATADRIGLVRSPWRTPAFGVRLLVAWLRLAWLARSVGDVDVVVVGYLGTFDVHLARLLFRRATVVLDEMAPLGGIADDRGIGGTVVRRLLDGADMAARRSSDVVVHDTTEHDTTPLRTDGTSVVVAVGAPAAWLRQEPAAPPQPGEALRVVFFGLYTPLQGAPVIAAGLALLPAGAPLRVTMVGDGQDRPRCQELLAGAPIDVRWLDWADPATLPALVAEHHVCLGIFGTGPKAGRVVPNKVFQGAAAGCAVVTSDTPPQRRLLGDAAILVPPGDPEALRDALVGLAADRPGLEDARLRSREWAARHASPEQVIRPLLRVLPV